MRPLSRNRLRSSSCFMAGVLIGILIGAVSFMLVVSYRMDLLYKKITYLEQILQDKNAILKKFEKNINTKSLTIKGIEVVLTFGGNEIDKMQIQKVIKEKYISLLGKEVKKVDPDIVVEVIDKRILKIGNRDYKLKVNKLLLTEILKIWVTAEPVND